MTKVEQSGIRHKALRDWVHRYKGDGTAAVVSWIPTRRLPRLNAAQLAQFYDPVVKGHDSGNGAVIH
ncbi:hypothetical protein SAMN05421828_1389 [Acidiphilium rubrum]|uniref:Uncharacterized protein n=1 Tax=Acidiphilium rubrum TaxID=526 RepID=A0A8G2CNQ8_ACIRU|nr:hypothetical protein SAMN05421828_1389 [Acidiphilium rubrum]